MGEGEYCCCRTLPKNPSTSKKGQLDNQNRIKADVGEPSFEISAPSAWFSWGVLVFGIMPIPGMVILPSGVRTWPDWNAINYAFPIDARECASHCSGRFGDDFSQPAIASGLIVKAIFQVPRLLQLVDQFANFYPPALWCAVWKWFQIIRILQAECLMSWIYSKRELPA